MFKIKSNLFLWCSFEKKNKYFFRDFFSQFIINKSNNYTGKKIKFAHLKIHIFACIFDNFQMAVQEWQSKIKCRGKKENFIISPDMREEQIAKSMYSLLIFLNFIIEKIRSFHNVPCFVLIFPLVYFCYFILIVCIIVILV